MERFWCYLVGTRPGEVYIMKCLTCLDYVLYEGRSYTDPHFRYIPSVDMALRVSMGIGLVEIFSRDMTWWAIDNKMSLRFG